MTRACWILLACILVLSAGAAEAAAPPLDVYGAEPALSRVSLSPSGRRAAYVGIVDGTRRIVVQEVGANLLVVVNLGPVKLRELTWAGDDFLIVITSATYSLGPAFVGSKWEIQSARVIDVRSRKAIGVFSDGQSIAKNGVFGFFGAAKVKDRWYGYFGGVTFGKSADQYFLEHTYPDLYQVDLETGHAVLAAHGTPSRRNWLVGANGAVLAHVDYDERSGEWRLSSGANVGPIVFHTTAPLGRIALLGQGRTPGTAVLINLANGVDHLTEVSLADGKTQDLLPDAAIPSDPEFGSSYIFDRTSGLFLGAVSLDGQGAALFDPVRQARLKGAFKTFPGYRTRLVSYDPTFDSIIMITDGGDDSGTYWFVDIPKRSAAPIGQARPDIKSDQVGPSRVYSYKAADGLALEGVLTLPPGRTPKSLPVVVMPHGGPIGVRDDVGFDWWAQAFAARGYAVFQPNYRGSSGHGAAFEEAGYGEWGRGMLSDIADGLASLARDGLVDPRKACIVGASYGGYAALAGVILQQGLYRCAASYGGVSDMADMRTWDTERSGEEVGGATMRYWRQAVRGGAKDAPSLSDISPDKHAERADAPILLIHGKDDTVVPIGQSRKMASALRDAHKPVELLELDGQDHWLTQQNARIQMLQAMVAFVEKYDPPD